MDFEQFDQRPLRDAQNGKLGPLIERLRKEKIQISQQEREFLADYLEAKPKKRGPKSKITRRDIDVYEAVEYLSNTVGMKRDAAEFQVAEWIGETDRNIRKRVTKVKRSEYLAVQSLVEEHRSFFLQNMKIFVAEDGSLTAHPLPKPRPNLLVRNGFPEE